MLLQIAAFLAATVYGAEIAKPKPRLTAPDVSLRTLPLAYFGGNSASRSATNLQMLAKMRIVVRPLQPGGSCVNALVGWRAPPAL